MALVAVVALSGCGDTGDGDAETAATVAVSTAVPTVAPSTVPPVVFVEPRPAYAWGATQREAVEAWAAAAFGPDTWERPWALDWTSRVRTPAGYEPVTGAAFPALRFKAGYLCGDSRTFAFFAAGFTNPSPDVEIDMTALETRPGFAIDFVNVAIVDVIPSVDWSSPVGVVVEAHWQAPFQDGVAPFATVALCELAMSEVAGGWAVDGPSRARSKVLTVPDVTAGMPAQVVSADGVVLGRPTIAGFAEVYDVQGLAAFTAGG